MQSYLLHEFRGGKLNGQTRTHENAMRGDHEYGSNRIRFGWCRTREQLLFYFSQMFCCTFRASMEKCFFAKNSTRIGHFYLRLTALVNGASLTFRPSDSILTALPTLGELQSCSNGREFEIEFFSLSIFRTEHSLGELKRNLIPTSHVKFREEAFFHPETKMDLNKNILSWCSINVITLMRTL